MNPTTKPNADVWPGLPCPWGDHDSLVEGDWPTCAKGDLKCLECGKPVWMWGEDNLGDDWEDFGPSFYLERVENGT